MSQLNAHHGHALVTGKLRNRALVERIGPDHPERTRRTRAIKLLPEKEPGLVQAMPLPPGPCSRYSGEAIMLPVKVALNVMSIAIVFTAALVSVGSVK